jgi:hypothetical protein
VLVVAFFGIKACLFSDSTTYSAVVQDFTAINPADLAVTVKVTNTGSHSGTPTCSITAHDASYAYHGVDAAQMAGAIAPGTTVTSVMNLTITSQGAAYVTDVTVKCS